MQKKSALGLRAACVLTLVLFLGGCNKAPTEPSTPGSSDLQKAATPFATPSPIPSPTASPSPSPDPAIPFDVFFIKEARAEWQRDPGDQRFEVEGLFVLAGAGNKLPDSAVTIVFGNFRVVIPGDSFMRNDDNDGFKLKREKAGLKEIEINDNGSFEVEGRDLNFTRGNFNEPVLFALQIGNARGQFRIPFDNDGRFENPNPLPSPSPSPTVSPSPSPSPTTSPSPLPSPTTSPSPLPSPTTSPSPLPSPTTSPSPLPSPTTSPSPLPSPTTSPSPLPSPTTSPSPSPSPELHLEGAIQALVVRAANSGDVTVQGVKFIVTSATRLEDEDGNDLTLNAFAIGEVVDAWGPSAVNGATQATRIRKE